MNGALPQSSMEVRRTLSAAAFNKVDGVEATVNFATESASIEYDLVELAFDAGRARGARHAGNTEIEVDEVSHGK